MTIITLRCGPCQTVAQVDIIFQTVTGVPEYCPQCGRPGALEQPDPMRDFFEDVAADFKLPNGSHMDIELVKMLYETWMERPKEYVMLREFAEAVQERKVVLS